MRNEDQQRTYSHSESVVFRKTNEPFGGLSNMASGFPIRVNDVTVLSSEALYQACRFPLRPDVQKVILAERSPMTAKMKSKRYRESSTRSDWDQVKVKIMRWCLRIKLVQNWSTFRELLLETDDKPIVEDSRRDDFWGAKRTEHGTLVGMNVLGRLLMELRHELTIASSEQFQSVPPLEIRDFLLLGKPIEPVVQVVTRKPIERPKVKPYVNRGLTESHATPHVFRRTSKIQSENYSLALWPTSAETEVAGDAGIDLVGLKVSTELHHIFRRKSVPDLGIDGEIEIREGNKSHGRLVAVQVKTGRSYLKEQTETGYIYRGSLAHLRYWLNYSMPVVLIVCDLDAKVCWWQVVDLQNVQFHESSWSIEIPFQQRVDANAHDAIRRIAKRLQTTDIIDLLFKNWLSEANAPFTAASILEQPRDYQWLRYLGKQLGQIIMADYVAADLQSFDVESINEMIRWAEYNHKKFGYDKFLLGLISQTPDAFPFRYTPALADQSLRVELVPLLAHFDDTPELNEMGEAGRLIASYHDEHSWDDFGQEVEPRRIVLPASALA
jgi:ribA/ribD-fused uncharacterized protein